MAKRQLTINLLGASLVIQSEESQEHLARITDYLRARIDEVKSRYSFSDPLTISLLAALNLTDELFRTREGRPSAAPADEIAGVAQRLIDTIDEELLRHAPYDARDGGASRDIDPS